MSSIKTVKKTKKKKKSINKNKIWKSFNKEFGKDEKLDFTYVEDLAEGTIKAAFNKKGENETFNITTGSGRTILSYAKILKKYFPIISDKLYVLSHVIDFVFVLSLTS